MSSKGRSPAKARKGSVSAKADDAKGLIAAIHRTQAVIEFELDGTIRNANENFLSVMGYTLDEIRGQHHRIFVEPEYAASADYQEFWNRLRRGEFDARQYKRIAKGGKEVWIQASYNPIFDGSGKPCKVIKFAVDITEQKRQETLNAAYKGALDGVTANVMVADNDLRITYMNQTATGLMRDAEPDFRRDLPQFDSKSLVGTNIDVFHKNPAHQRGILRDLNEPISSQLELGGRTMKIIASPMKSPDGKRLGTVVEWIDRTEELKREREDRERAERDARIAAENARVRAALDKVTTNVMMADSDLNIVYLNDTVQEMMQKAQSDIRKELPQFDVNKLIGTNIDTFHKNPAHQRGMLASLSGTFTSQLELGGRTFRIIANPVVDEGGQRIGTVVEWADRTQEVAVEREVESIVNQARAGDLGERIEMQGKEGFFKTLGGSINSLLDVCDQVLSDTIRVFGALSRGNLTETISADYEGAFERLKNDANQTITQLTDTVSKIKSAAEAVPTRRNLEAATDPTFQGKRRTRLVSRHAFRA